MLTCLYLERRLLVDFEAAKSSEMNTGVGDLFDQRCFIVCLSFRRSIGDDEANQLLYFAIEYVVAESIRH